MIFFLDNTELRDTNCAFESALQESANLFSLVKRYGEWMTQVYEEIHNEMIIMRKELKQ